MRWGVLSGGKSKKGDPKRWYALHVQGLTQRSGRLSKEEWKQPSWRQAREKQNQLWSPQKLANLELLQRVN